MKITYSQEAKEDIKSIWQYVAQENIDAADMIVKSIHKQVRLISDFPMLGKHYSHKVGNIRTIISGNHVVFYRAEDSQIIIIRVLSSRQDIKNIL